MEDINTDVLVIGAGIAGMSFALKMAERTPNLKIDLIAKSGLHTSNTQLAQGGIAAVTEEGKDTREKHFLDTLTASRNTSDPAITRKIINHAPEAIRELLDWGVSFDRNDNGTFNRGQEGAHSHPRVLHNKDQTGAELVQKLSQRLKECTNIHIHTYHMALDLRISDDTGNRKESCHCQGAYAFDLCSGKPKVFSAPVTYLASGGAGQVFKHTTNASVATGDATAMALRAGLPLRKMGFYQYHPTVLYLESNCDNFLVSEAVRGAGAQLRNQTGEAFMANYHPLADLASRDMVTEAEYREMNKAGSPHLYLDATKIPEATWKTHFPGIYNHCLRHSINPVKNWIPVVPAAHYQCGGIPVDECGQTAMPGLFAGGECACSGLHGNNRLASNSLLEGVVLAQWTAQSLPEAFSDTHRDRTEPIRWTLQKPSDF